jgi:hypothetical protein
MSLLQFPTLTRFRVITCDLISGKLMISMWRYPARNTALHYMPSVFTRRDDAWARAKWAKAPLARSTGRLV